MSGAKIAIQVWWMIRVQHLGKEDICTIGPEAVSGSLVSKGLTITHNRIEEKWFQE